MKTCAKCGHANKDEAKFCGACGNKLEPAAPPPPPVEQQPAEVICPVCGSKNRAGVHFCGQCGADLSRFAQAAPPPPSHGAGAAPAVSPERLAAQAGGTTLPNLGAPSPQAAPGEVVELPAPGPAPAEPAPVEPESPAATAGEEPVTPAPEAISAAAVAPVEPDPSVQVMPPLVAAPVEAAAESHSAATCAHCGTVIRYCPCCGKPLAG